VTGDGDPHIEPAYIGQELVEEHLVDLLHDDLRPGGRNRERH
jgi:hypothetical protein